MNFLMVDDLIHSSRSGYEDSDDEEAQEIILTWTGESDIPSSSIVFVACHPVAVCAVSAMFLNSKCIAKLLDLNSVEIAHLWKSSSEVFYLVVSEKAPVEVSNKIAETLLKNMVSKVIVFDVLEPGTASTIYLDSGAHIPPVLRAIHSSTVKTTFKCELLSAPNLISGVGAAVLSRCELMKIPCSLYASLLESTNNFAIESIQAYDPVFKNILVNEKIFPSMKQYGQMMSKFCKSTPSASLFI